MELHDEIRNSYEFDTHPYLLPTAYVWKFELKDYMDEEALKN